MRAVKIIISSFFPFLVFDILLGFTTPPALIVTVLLALLYVKYRITAQAGTKTPPFLYIFVALYWLAIAFIGVYFARILYHFTFYRVVMILAGGGLVIPAVTRKWRPEICAGLFLNLCALMFAMNMLPQGVNDDTILQLKAEPYARPVYAFLDMNKENIGNVRPSAEGIRSIIADSDEDAIYFTIDHNGKNAVTLARVALDKGEEKKIFMGERLFGLAFTPDEKTLLSTDYYGSKLLMFEPEALQLQDSRDTESALPQFIVVDPRGERVTVIHEGRGAASVFSLPDLKFHEKKKLSSAPGKIAVDYETRTMYAANFQPSSLLPYLLTEIEIFSLKTKRKKFPFAFDSAGVDLDLKRNRVYVTRGLSGEIIGVDRTTWEVVDRIKTEPFVRPVSIDEQRELILVGNMVDPFLRVYGFDGKLKAKIFIGPNCREIYITSKTGRVFAGSNLGLLELKIEQLMADIAKSAEPEPAKKPAAKKPAKEQKKEKPKKK